MMKNGDLEETQRPARETGQSAVKFWIKWKGNAGF